MMTPHFLPSTLLLSAASLCLASCHNAGDDLSFAHQGDTLTVVHVVREARFVLLPVQENRPEAQVMLGDVPMDVRLAVDKVDYTVPFPLRDGADSLVVRGLAAKAVPGSRWLWPTPSTWPTAKLSVRSTTIRRPTAG